MKSMMINFAAGIIVMLAGCRSNDNENLPQKSVKIKDTYVVKSNQTDPASNPSNPVDYIGFQHNVGLDSLRHYVKVTGDTTRRGTYAFLNRYFKNNFGLDGHFSYDPNERLACTNYQALWFNQKISVVAMGYWHSLSDAVQSIRDLDHYNAYKHQIVAIENKISTDQLAADEKKNLLLASSILRYSAYYWINAFNKGAVVYHNEGSGMAMPESFLRKIAGVITGICADASVIAAGYFSGDYTVIGDAILLSECCGYYTGWW